MSTAVQNFVLPSCIISAFLCQIESSEFALFSVDYNRRNCPVANCALAGNAVSRDSGMFNGRSVVIGVLLQLDNLTNYYVNQNS
jgi:hypothetical protein